MNLAQMEVFLQESFPQGEQYGVIDQLGSGWALFKLPVNGTHLRPGGTVSGPTMMGMADVAFYAALLSKIGPVPLAVTTNLNINFLNKPQADAALCAKASLLKLGKRLAVGEVSLYSEGAPERIVAHATLTYSIPN